MPAPASRTTVLASCGLLAAGVLLCGCGGGSDRSAAPASSSSTAAPTVTAGPSQTQAPTASPSPSAPTAPTATATSTSTPTGAAPVAGPSPCPSSRLGISVRAEAGGGTAGSVYESVVFVNQGSATCTLTGHPGVSYVVGADGHQVGAAAGRTGVPATVSLAPGASAHAQLRVVSYGSYDLDTCQPSPVEGFRIYPPDQTAAAFVVATGTTCANPAVVLLTVGPVAPGSTD